MKKILVDEACTYLIKNLLQSRINLTQIGYVYEFLKQIDFPMELVGIYRVYFIILFHIRYVTSLHPIQEENSEEGVSSELAARNLVRTYSFGLPVLRCENNICSLSVEARIPLTSITVGGKIIVGYNVVTENTISGEGRLIYANNSTGKNVTFGLRLSIALEGLDELQIRLDVIWGKNETYFSIGGELGTDLPKVCAPMPATPSYIMFCITIGDYKYFHDDRLVICLRAEIQFCEYRMVTLLYKCLSFTKFKMKAINQKLKTVSSFSKSQYDAAKLTLKSVPSFRQNSFKDEGRIDNRQPTELNKESSNEKLEKNTENII